MENRFIDENYFDFIIPNFLLDFLSENQKYTKINTRHSIIHVPYVQANKCDFDSINYAYLPACFTLESTFALEQTGVKKVQNNPNLGFYGTGILIGIIDSGINYLHPAFLYADGTSRIAALWDQTVNPEDADLSIEFPYGTMYTKEEINIALNHPFPLEIVPTNDENGHGTAIAGIVAGSTDTANDFSGVAPLAEFVVVKLKEAKKTVKEFLAIPEDTVCYQENDIMMGVKYVDHVAKRLNRPLALCIALGSNQGSHDGLGALSIYLNQLSELPKNCVITCAGNEGNNRRHFSGSVSKEDPFTEFELNVGSEDTKFFMEIWTQPILRVSLEIISPTGEKISNLIPGFDQKTKHTFVFGSTIICINNIITEPESGDQLIWLRFDKAQSGVWKFRNYNIDKNNATFNVWLPSGDIITKDTYFVQSDPFMTIITPGNGEAQLTITSYDTFGGGISTFSSKGFTRVQEIKPDLAAPGSELTAPSNRNGYVNITGTGAAAAISTGIVALLLEWAITRGIYTNITGVEVKTLLIRGAQRDLNIDYPNRTWGFGKIDLYGVFDKLII